MPLSQTEAALAATANAKARASGKFITPKPRTPQVAALPGMTPLGIPVPPTGRNSAQRAKAKDVAKKLAATANATAVAEAQAKASNAAKLATAVRKQAAAPTLAKGSGALIGVAQGALDGQPHTRQAVKEARAKAQAALTQGGMVRAKDIAGNTVTVASTDPCLVHGVLYPNKSRANDARRAYTAQELADAKAAASGKPAPSKQAKAPRAPPKRAPASKVDRKYAKGATAYTGAAGTWTAYMVAHALAHKSTDAATAAHKAGAAKAGQRADKPLDFKWMDAKGYIKLV